MNENISIKEGGLTRRFSPIDRVKVNNTDGTESVWMPKDDIQTGTLYATKNGIYIASEDGYDAYDEVVIRVTDDSEWADVYPDNSWTWDEATYESYMEDPEAFDNLFNDETKWEDPGENLDYKYGEDGISGIDSDTGNEAMVNLDENGFLNETPLPSSIRIIIEPFKKTYIDGESIDFYGLVVDMLNADGTDFESETYPSGLVPYNELVFPVKTASLEAAGGRKSYKSNLCPDGIPTCLYYARRRSDVISFTDSCVTGRGVFYKNNESSGWVERVLATEHEGGIVSQWFSYNYITGEMTGSGTITADQSYTYNGKTAYYNSGARSDAGSIEPDLPILSIQHKGKAAWTLLYGEFSGGIQTIPVNWIRDDGEILSDSFEIEVIPGESSSGSGGKSDGDIVDNDGRFTWDGRNYILNKDRADTIHYANGYVWVEGASTEYNMEQAEDLGLIIPVP